MSTFYFVFPFVILSSHRLRTIKHEKHEARGAALSLLVSSERSTNTRKTRTFLFRGMFCQGGGTALGNSARLSRIRFRVFTSKTVASVLRINVGNDVSVQRPYVGFVSCITVCVFQASHYFSPSTAPPPTSSAKRILMVRNS